jgi:hypothetical protein
VLLLPTTKVSKVFLGLKGSSRAPAFHGARFAGFAQGRGLGVGDVELDLQGLTDRLDQRIVDQAQIIIREPHFTKLVGYFQRKGFAGERAGLQRRKPEMVKIRVERAAQNLLRGNPNLLGRCLHFACSKNSRLAGIIHLSIFHASNTPRRNTLRRRPGLAGSNAATTSECEPPSSTLE